MPDDMTVPPEILRRAAEAVAAYFHYDEDETDLGLAEVYIAAVYGDIVEAARRISGMDHGLRMARNAR